MAYCECIEPQELIIELILRNIKLIYDNEEFKSLIRKSVDFLENHKEYQRYFRQKADSSYRKECQKVYIQKILEKSSLESVPINMIVALF